MNPSNAVAFISPERIIMYNRDGEAAVWLERAKVWFGTESAYLDLLDPETGEHRNLSQADLVDGFLLCDALPNIHWSSCWSIRPSRSRL